MTNQFKGSLLNLILKRSIHRGLPKFDIEPVLNFDDAEKQKSLILKECKNKSFVYRWVNKLNNKDYLGSTTNAKVRISKYYDKFILTNVKMPIYKALLKHKHSNFIFQIVEFCKSSEALSREQYYLDHFDFDYNILAKADSSLGFKHTLETLIKLKGRKNALGFKHTLETIDKLRKIQKNKKHSEESLKKMRELWAERKLKLAAGSLLKEPKLNPENLKIAYKDQESLSVPLPIRKKIKGKLVLVTNIETNLSKEYNSISEAALALNINRSTLRNYINNKNIFNLVKIDGSDGGLQIEKLLITFLASKF